MTENKIFIHHVYFWLNNNDSIDDRNNLIEGLKKLSKVASIKTFHIGKPADTNRDVIDIRKTSFVEMASTLAEV